MNHSREGAEVMEMLPEPDTRTAAVPPAADALIPHQRFPAECKLRRQEEYDRVFRYRCKTGDALLLIFAAPNGLNVTRLGLCVSRRVGKAVVRNQLKRWVREAFRVTRAELPLGFDVVILPQKADGASFQSYCEAIPRLVRRLTRRCKTFPHDESLPSQPVPRRRGKSPPR